MSNPMGDLMERNLREVFGQRESDRLRFSTATRTRAAVRCLSCRLPRSPACSPPIQVASTSTSPCRGSPAAFTMARRSLCSIIHAVS
jgi:hypothetical protein